MDRGVHLGGGKVDDQWWCLAVEEGWQLQLSSGEGGGGGISKGQAITVIRGQTGENQGKGRRKLCRLHKALFVYWCSFSTGLF